MRSSVDLPQPDGPTITMNSPSATSVVDAVDDLEVAVALAHVAEIDFGHRYTRSVDDVRRCDQQRRQREQEHDVHDPREPDGARRTRRAQRPQDEVDAAHEEERIERDELVGVRAAERRALAPPRGSRAPRCTGRRATPSPTGGAAGRRGRARRVLSRRRSAWSQRRALASTNASRQLRPSSAMQLRDVGAHFSVSTRPLTNQRCIRITTTAGGSIARIAVAITRCHSIVASPPPAIIRLMPITTRVVVLLRGDDQRPQVLVPAVDELDHEQRRHARSCDIGTTTSQKNRIGPAPSMRAASASSSGIVRKNWRNRNVAVADAISGSGEPGVAVEHAEVGDDLVRGQDAHLDRQHQRDEDHPEEEVAAAESGSRRSRTPRAARSRSCRSR